MQIILFYTECNKLQNDCWCIKLNNEYINICVAKIASEDRDELYSTYK